MPRRNYGAYAEGVIFLFLFKFDKITAFKEDLKHLTPYVLSSSIRALPVPNDGCEHGNYDSIHDIPKQLHKWKSTHWRRLCNHECLRLLCLLLINIRPVSLCHRDTLVFVSFFSRPDTLMLETWLVYDICRMPRYIHTWNVSSFFNNASVVVPVSALYSMRCTSSMLLQLRPCHRRILCF